MKKIVLVNPRYPYGKDSVYLNGSINSIGARLVAMGCVVDVIDFNLDRINDARIDGLLRSADYIGVSLTGAPYIPGTLELIDTLRSRGVNAPVLLGGQVVARLEPNEFAAIVGNRTNVYQIRNDQDLANAIGCVPSANVVPFVPLWERLGETRMAEYLRHEGTLVVSQGCKKSCKFCAASKARREEFRNLEVFTTDLQYLAALADRHGLTKLEFYASSLDFFQNPAIVIQYLDALKRVRRESRVDIRVRCLACMDSFLAATASIPDLGQRLNDAGLWCIGFGADGTDPSIWHAQHKHFNQEADIWKCLKWCREYGVQPELLMVFGFPEDTIATLAKTVRTCLAAVREWPDVVIRPYLAKPFVPGNDLWATKCAGVEQVVANPELFYQLDFAALGSTLTHPRWWHRWACNLTYLAICALWFKGRSTTAPLLPQGGRGARTQFARFINQLMPFDR